MKLKEFLVLQNRKNILEKNLIDTTGGNDISISELWNKIYFKIEEYVADESEDEEITEMITRTLSNYQLRTSKIKKKTKLLMTDLGFKIIEDFK